MVVTNRYNRVYVKLNSSDLTAGLGSIKNVYKKFSPDRPFDYTFLNEDSTSFTGQSKKPAQFSITLHGSLFLFPALGCSAW